MKRIRSDSAAVAVGAMVSASLPALKPPKQVKVPRPAMAYWSGIIASRARDEWSDIDLVVAAQLAVCQWEIERESHELRAEGSVLVNARGTQIMNPRHSVVAELARREMALMRTLRMGGKAAGDPRDESGRRKLERESREIRAQIESEDDELLAS